MSVEPTPTTESTRVTPVTSLDDPRVLQILSTEHWSLLAGRSLAYNEALTRGAMFLTFLSFSFVALALLGQAITFSPPFLTIAAVVLAFDFAIGLATVGRIAGANVDDLRAVHGMARIRHGYTQIAPIVAPYFTTATHDDIPSVLTAYGASRLTGLDFVLYGFTTSGGMIGLITTMVGGVFAAVLSLSLGVSEGLSVGIGIGSAALVFVLLIVAIVRSAAREQAALPVAFPAPQRPHA
jgi:hypothetical protein